MLSQLGSAIIIIPLIAILESVAIAKAFGEIIIVIIIIIKTSIITFIIIIIITFNIIIIIIIIIIIVIIIIPLIAILESVAIAKAFGEIINIISIINIKTNIITFKIIIINIIIPIIAILDNVTIAKVFKEIISIIIILPSPSLKAVMDKLIYFGCIVEAQSLSAL